MGLLQNGEWVDKWYETSESGGKFVRPETYFRNWITRDGSPGPSGCGGFKAELNRYHLYVSYACPWAHRALIFRVIKKLESIISISAVHWYMGKNGWTFAKGHDVIPDTVNNCENLYEIYTMADGKYSGRVTVPILWDKKQNTIVSNESSEIIRMLNSAFDEVGAVKGDYYPDSHKKEIDEINQKIYKNINNGVYKAGFATTQDAYENAVIPLFDTLDWVDELLGKQKYLVGSSITEADWRLFTTLIRFDPVYVGHFKCNIRRIVDYQNLQEYIDRLLEYPGVKDTVKMKHIKSHYYQSHPTINPSGIVPVGPIDSI